MRIKDLKQTFVILSLSEKTTPAYKKGYTQIGVQTFPEKIIVHSYYPYGADLTQVQYLVEALTIKTIYLPNDFKVEIIQDETLQKELDRYIKLNALDNLGGNYFFVGSDPEIFVEDEEKKVIPAFDFLGSKENPDKTFYLTQGGAAGQSNMYWDGFQAEFVTMANSCLSWQVDSVYSGLKGVYEKAKAHNKNSKLSIKTCMDISEELLQSSKDEHVQFGCMPSFNNYGMQGIKDNGRNVLYRSAGGHIHFGIGKKDPKVVENIVLALDSILGVACVGLFQSFDDPRRRRMYGLAGEYRLPPHGLEYRTLSNAWLSHPLVMHLVFDLARTALKVGEKGFLDSVWDCPKEKTIQVINECDIDGAKEILEKNKTPFLRMLALTYGTAEPKALEIIFNAFKNGMETIINDPTDIESNWNLKTGQYVTHSDGIDKNFSKARATLVAGKKAA